MIESVWCEVGVVIDTKVWDVLLMDGRMLMKEEKKKAQEKRKGEA